MRFVSSNQVGGKMNRLLSCLPDPGGARIPAPGACRGAYPVMLLDGESGGPYHAWRICTARLPADPSRASRACRNRQTPGPEPACSQVASIANPDAIPGWYRKLAAGKFDGSRQRRLPGRSTRRSRVLANLGHAVKRPDGRQHPGPLSQAPRRSSQVLP
jgi:hypothetical protein